MTTVFLDSFIYAFKGYMLLALFFGALYYLSLFLIKMCKDFIKNKGELK